MTTTQSPPLRDVAIARATQRRERTALVESTTPQRNTRATIACVERSLSDRLATLLPDAIAIPRSARLVDLAGEGGVRLVIGDPTADGGLCLDALLRIRAESPSVMVVVYTTLRATVVSGLLELARCGVKDVVLYRTDDTKSRFGELIDRAATRPLTSSVIALLEDLFRVSRRRSSQQSSRCSSRRVESETLTTSPPWLI